MYSLREGGGVKGCAVRVHVAYVHERRKLKETSPGVSNVASTCSDELEALFALHGLADGRLALVAQVVPADVELCRAASTD